MQIVSLLGDNLHEISNPFFWKNKKNIISLSSAEYAHSMVSVKMLKNTFYFFFFLLQIYQTDLSL